MKLRLRYWLTCAGCALPCGAALGQTTGNAPMLGRHEQVLARFEQMPEHRLKALFLLCSAEATQRLLRRYLECGILAHGFARARCECGHDFLIASPAAVLKANRPELL